VDMIRQRGERGPCSILGMVTHTPSWFNAVYKKIQELIAMKVACAEPYNFLSARV